MILISHRGNLNGKISILENKPSYCQEAIGKGFDVEIDVWYENSSFYLGHDKPTHKIDIGFLKKNGLWCHAKNIDALRIMLSYSDIHCFWHQEDDVTLTSRGYIWTYPKQQITDKSVCYLEEKEDIPKRALGICSDYILYYKNLINKGE